MQLCSVDIGTLQCAIVSMVCWQLRVRGDKNLMQLCNVDIGTLQWGHHYIGMQSPHCGVDIGTLQFGQLDMHTIYCGHHYITMYNCVSGYQNIAMYTQWGQSGVLATKNSRRHELDATLEIGHHYIEMWTSVQYTLDIATLQCTASF